MGGGEVIRVLVGNGDLAGFVVGGGVAKVGEVLAVTERMSLGVERAVPGGINRVVGGGRGGAIGGGRESLVSDGVPTGFVDDEGVAEVGEAPTVTTVRSSTTEGESGDDERWLERGWYDNVEELPKEQHFINSHQSSNECNEDPFGFK
ncbi:hypothetical protein GUJ93_ZPchr0001g30318 [Zizania palustris]|uniref:Uncharacterized protein n=1 Tax=Zizania palustris TaxID=103762 RepID=A0A8J5VLU0_ZIZPA|nr:hypothetical protein GUJ93_ZPchr0001g30318 [Zizania palustris]